MSLGNKICAPRKRPASTPSSNWSLWFVKPLHMWNLNWKGTWTPRMTVIALCPGLRGTSLSVCSLGCCKNDALMSDGTTRYPCHNGNAIIKIAEIPAAIVHMHAFVESQFFSTCRLRWWRCIGSNWNKFFDLKTCNTTRTVRIWNFVCHWTNQRWNYESLEKMAHRLFWARSISGRIISLYTMKNFMENAWSCGHAGHQSEITARIGWWWRRNLHPKNPETKESLPNVIMWPKNDIKKSNPPTRIGVTSRYLKDPFFYK